VDLRGRFPVGSVQSSVEFAKLTDEAIGVVESRCSRD